MGAAVRFDVFDMHGWFHPEQSKKSWKSQTALVCDVTVWFHAEEVNVKSPSASRRTYTHPAIP